MLWLGSIKSQQYCWYGNMAYKQFILKIDEELFNEFIKACDNKDLTAVLTKLIKQFIRDKKISDSFDEKPEHVKLSEFRKYLKEVQK